ncbi:MULTISPECIES: TonB-system energizer ExbB [unclassified Helicobacter]|uniref:TonB-system energizer ExbB n=1 Tax=unclassified Helicobacter TaxID=2593540 RepID=UPI0018F84F41|nr:MULTISPECIES: TonB-system energizer ExbB [unclassified Helicobacter]
MKEYLDYAIIGFLLFLSVIVLTIGIERIWFYATVRVDDYQDKRELELDLHKRLTLMATIGSNAPYIGLLGTVAGIMITFMGISNTSMSDTSEIMKGLALALKATAMGLIVAIPSIVFYNMLIRKSEVIITKWDIYHNPIATDKKQEKRLDRE